MKKKDIKKCILITCISYAAASMLLSLLACFSGLMMDINNITNLQLFACNALIAILIHFTSRLPVESEIGAMVIQFLDIAAVIYGVGGGIFKWLAWEPRYIVEVFLILLLVFFVTYAFMIWENNVAAKAINDKIKERRK